MLSGRCLSGNRQRNPLDRVQRVPNPSPSHRTLASKTRHDASPSRLLILLSQGLIPSLTSLLRLVSIDSVEFRGGNGFPSARGIDDIRMLWLYIYDECLLFH